jgi:tetratricopeptide (TPR) repeat protein
LLLNPFDPVLCGAAMFTYTAVGDHAAALSLHELCKEANPGHPVTWGAIGTMFEQERRWDEAIATYRRAAELSHRTHYIIGSLGHALAKSGHLDEARDILDEVLSAPSPYAFAVSLLQLGLGNHQEATRWFAKGLDQREPHTVLAGFDPRFAALRENAQFRQLLKNMGVAVAATA